MWEQVYPELPSDIAAVTTSVWEHEDYCHVGVMRNSFLAPPVLWIQLIKHTPSKLKMASALVTALQHIISADLVLAEAKLDEVKSQRFLTFLGFVEGPESLGRKQFHRSI